MKAELIQKSRKEYRCGKCGKVIEASSPYYRITGMYMPTRFRCKDCIPERSELTTSDYLSWLYNMQDHFDDLYDFEGDGILEEISEELSNKADELQGRLDEMPEAFQDTSDAGIQLSERIESLQDAQNEVDCLEYPDREDDEYQVEDDESTAVFDEELASALSQVLTSYPTADDAYTLEQVKEFMFAAGYVLADDEEDEGMYLDDEFDVVFEKDGKSVSFHFEKRTHFDEEAYEEAVDDLRESVREIIGNISE